MHALGRRLRASLVAVALCALGTAAGAKPPVEQGRLRVVTYNVAGLPDGISRAHPLQNLPLIGASLERYDLALVQEDFAYPELLRSRLRLPFQSRPFQRGEALHFGDGLSQFAKLPLSEVRRVPWGSCNGVLDAFFDCLTPKGISLSRMALGPTTSLDVYNVHLDAGWSSADVEARRAQIEQLAQLLAESSAGRAVLVGGDFNLSRAELPGFFQRIEAEGLTDVCRYLRCRDDGRIDRFSVSERRRGQLEAALLADRWITA